MNSLLSAMLLVSGFLPSIVLAQGTLMESPPIEIQRKEISGYRLVDYDVYYQSVITPYAKEYAYSRGLELTGILFALGIRPSDIFKDKSEYRRISSYRYQDGNWSGFEGKGIKVFEIIRLDRKAPHQQPLVLVLHKETDWLLSVIEGGTAMTGSKKLQTVDLSELARKKSLQTGDGSIIDPFLTYLGFNNDLLNVVITSLPEGNIALQIKGAQFRFRFREKDSRFAIETVRAVEGKPDIKK